MKTRNREAKRPRRASYNEAEGEAQMSKESLPKASLCAPPKAKKAHTDVAEVQTSEVSLQKVKPYMTEGFIISAFKRMGENPLSVKVMRNQITGELAGYCFVHFGDDDEAVKAMHKLNGKFIPNSNPPQRFRLNHATSGSRSSMSDADHSLWVGDLTQEVDDYQLYKFFASRYESIRTAKVVVDSSGKSKGYGFIRFANEEEQKHCLVHMNRHGGLGSTLIKVSRAVPKGQLGISSSMMSGGYNASQDYSQNYDSNNYWQSYTAWQSYYDSTAGGQAPNNSFTSGPPPSRTMQEDDLELIDHNMPVDVDSWNRELMERDFNLWDALESSKWLPLETYT